MQFWVDQWVQDGAADVVGTYGGGSAMFYFDDGCKDGSVISDAAARTLLASADHDVRKVQQTEPVHFEVAGGEDTSWTKLWRSGARHLTQCGYVGSR